MISPQTMVLGYNVDQMWPLAVAFVVLIVAVRLGWRFVKRYRQQVFEGDSSGFGWSMEDLERMRDGGQLTEQEFKILRDQTMRGFMRSGQGKSSKRPNSSAKRNDNIDTQ